jgi:hypothetical protein
VADQLLDVRRPPGGQPATGHVERGCGHSEADGLQERLATRQARGDARGDRVASATVVAHLDARCRHLHGATLAQHEGAAGATGDDEVLDPPVGPGRHQLEELGIQRIRRDDAVPGQVLVAGLQHVDAAGEHGVAEVARQIGDGGRAVALEIDHQPAVVVGGDHLGGGVVAPEDAQARVEARGERCAVEVVAVVASEDLGGLHGQHLAVTGAPVVDVGAVGGGDHHGTHLHLVGAQQSSEDVADLSAEARDEGRVDAEGVEHPGDPHALPARVQVDLVAGSVLDGDRQLR